MNGRELYILGRRLTKIAESSMPSRRRLPRGVALVLEDIYVHPDSSVSEITARTGLPQSHVSTSVARLREAGAAVTSVDPADGRRTLVRVSDRTAAIVGEAMGAPVDAALADALGGAEPDEIARVLGLLEALAERLLPENARGPGREVIRPSMHENY